MAGKVDFFASEGGRFVARAKCFLEAANVLTIEMRADNNRMLFSPTLHLIGHGLELLLKGHLIHNGMSKARAVKFGHDVNSMWDLEEACILRSAAIANAHIAHQEEVAHGYYGDAFLVDDVPLFFEEYRKAIGDLHGERGVFALRYPTEEDRYAPRVPLVVGALWRTADDYVKRPAEFLDEDI